MNKLHSYTESKKTVVALFDILGFREKVNNTPGWSFINLLEGVKGLSEKAGNIGPKVVGSMFFSDTIILFNQPCQIEFGVAAVTVASHNLLINAWNAGIAVRGAISVGPMIISESHRQAIGKPLVKAYDLEKSQDWMGAIIDPECEDLFEKVFSAKDALPITIKYPAPLKIGKRREFLCIRWIYDGWRIGHLKKIFKGESESHEIYRKYRNTLDFFHYCTEINKRIPI